MYKVETKKAILLQTSKKKDKSSSEIFVLKPRNSLPWQSIKLNKLIPRETTNRKKFYLCVKVSIRNRPTKEVAYWKFLIREMKTSYKSENKRESSPETCQLFYVLVLSELI